MNEFVFILMFFTKELIEFIAVRKKQVHLKFVRGLLIISSLMLLHAILLGSLDEWHPIFRMLMIIGTILDIVLIYTNKYISTRGGN